MTTRTGEPLSFDGSLTPVCIVVYLALHAIWTEIVFGPFSFFWLRVLFLAAIALWLWFAGKSGEIAPYFLGRMISMRDLPAAGLILALLVMLRCLSMWHLIHFHLLGSYSVAQMPSDCIIAPVNEEIVFRGLFLAIILQAMPRRPIWAIALNALIFASVHNFRSHGAVNWDFLIELLVPGFIYGWLYFRTRCVTWCILAHSLWNVFPFLPRPS